jgi:hypothetical protein
MLRIDPAQLETVGMKEILEYLIDKHSGAEASKLQRYYIGEHDDILDRSMKDSA